MRKEVSIVHCCTYAATYSAHIRLHKALLNQGVDSKVLSLKEPQQMCDEMYSIKQLGMRYQKYQKYSYYLNILNYLSLSKIFGLQENMPYNLGVFGVDISQNELVQQADIIHLHWINDCFLSLRCLKKLVSLKKPIVITLHDSWFLTGGCHVLNECHNFEKNCEGCPQITHMKSIPMKMLNIKKKIFEEAKVILVAPGRWTKQNALKSSILNKKKCVIIGNTLDFSIFDIHNVEKEKKVVLQSERIKILFGAINGTTAPHKGFFYLLKMLKLLKEEYPSLAQKIELNIFGSSNAQFEELEGYKYHFWGYVEEEIRMAELYNMCDVYIVPSLEDSFNQTVLESCTCGTPVVSFQTGGICDIIKHKETGYLAEYKNELDLLNGLLWILKENVDNCIGKAARQDVEKRFSEEKIIGEFINLYSGII